MTFDILINGNLYEVDILDITHVSIDSSKIIKIEFKESKIANLVESFIKFFGSKK